MERFWPKLTSLLKVIAELDANFGRVKSGNFGHQVNSDICFQTVEIQMRRLLTSRLIRIFTVCLVNSFFYSSN